MKSLHKNLIIYILVLIIFGGLIYLAIAGGESIETIAHKEIENAESAFLTFCNVIVENINHSFSILLIQIIVVLLFIRLFSVLFNYIGQPNVIGEIVAGIVLGPSVFGALFPDVFNFIFRPDSLKGLELISHLGLALFMFVIGMEVDFKVLKNKVHKTLVISHTGILFPFFCGAVVSYIIYNKYAASMTPFLPFVLIIGVSMSITAFPILARMIQERNLTKKPVGILAIGSAANDDITAWCLLTFVLAITKAGTFASALYIILIVIVYILAMFLVVRPFLKKIGQKYSNREVFNKSFVAFIFIIFIVSSAFTEILGVHALLGSFIAGIVMPSNFGFRKVMMEKIEDVTLVLFLPLFFALTGLRTQIGLINSFDLLLVALLFIAAAVIGKFGGCSIAAKFVGESWKNSFIIGTLMNTRGLLELVALNIGYELGVLPQPIFVILVLMTLVTTFMTTPMLDVIDKIYDKNKGNVDNKELLLLFGRPFSGARLLSVYYMIFGNSLKRHRIVAIHYTLGTNLNYISAQQYSKESFRPIEEMAARIGVNIVKQYKITDNLYSDIMKTINKESPNMVLMGSSSKIMNEHHHGLIGFFGLFKNRADQIIKKISSPIGVLINHQRYKGRKLSALIYGKSEMYVLELIQQMVELGNKNIDIYYVKNKDNSFEEVVGLRNSYKEKIIIHEVSRLEDLKFKSDTGLVIVGYETCKRIMINVKLFNTFPSLLMIKGNMFK